MHFYTPNCNNVEIEKCKKQKKQKQNKTNKRDLKKAKKEFIRNQYRVHQFAT